MNKDKIKKTKIYRDLKMLYKVHNNSDFSNWIKDYDECSSILKFQQLGELNSDKNIYLINFQSSEWGFFAYWRFGLLCLAFAERYHLTPVIQWSNNSPYYDSQYVKDTDTINNPFEYFYQPVSNISVEDAYKSKNVVFYSKNACGYGSVLYNQTMDVDLVDLCKKYYKLNDSINSKLMKEIEVLLNGKKTLAVHVRGVEWGNIKGHPVPVSLEKYIESIKKAYINGFSQIFLATDSTDTITYFKKEMKEYNIVLYNDVMRAQEGSHTLAIFDKSVERANNQFLLGYEVLRDMMTISYCDGIIASYSNISLAAETTKASRGETYLYKEIYDTKLNSNGISAKKAVEKMKKGKY